MNLGQMRFRCPDAEVVGNVRLEDYRLAFRGRAPGNGVATVLPEKEAMWMESYGRSQKLVKRIWIFMKDFRILWERNHSGKGSGWNCKGSIRIHDELPS